MNEPTVTLTLNLERVQTLRPDDGPLTIGGWSTVYVVTEHPWTDDPAEVTVVVVKGDVQVQAVRD